MLDNRKAMTAAALVAGIVMTGAGVGVGIGHVVRAANAPAAHQHSSAMSMPDGLNVSSENYTLELSEPVLDASALSSAGGSLGDTGVERELSFMITDERAQPVTNYRESHDELLHMVLVRRDTTGFQHVHPQLGDDGVWRVPVELGAGSWRVFTDFVPDAGSAAGANMVLGADLEVAGAYRPEGRPPVSTSDEVDGYTVSLDGGLVGGSTSELELSITRDGEEVALEPYMGAYGHLVALRVGDLAYSHVHPDDGDGVGSVDFSADVPSAGLHRLYFDFKHEGQVHTAEFTLEAAPGSGVVSGGDGHSHQH